MFPTGLHFYPCAVRDSLLDSTFQSLGRWVSYYYYLYCDLYCTHFMVYRGLACRPPPPSHTVMMTWVWRCHVCSGVTNCDNLNKCDNHNKFTYSVKGAANVINSVWQRASYYNMDTFRPQFLVYFLLSVIRLNNKVVLFQRTSFPYFIFFYWLPIMKIPVLFLTITWQPGSVSDPPPPCSH